MTRKMEVTMTQFRCVVVMEDIGVGLRFDDEVTTTMTIGITWEVGSSIVIQAVKIPRLWIYSLTMETRGGLIHLMMIGRRGSWTFPVFIPPQTIMRIAIPMIMKLWIFKSFWMFPAILRWMTRRKILAGNRLPRRLPRRHRHRHRRQRPALGVLAPFVRDGYEWRSEAAAK
jgi:hypothetical protein